LPLTNFEVSDSAGVGLGQVNGLFESDGSFYAYGSYPRDAEKGPQAAVWTSTDHVGWTRVSDFPGIEGQEPSVAEAVTDMTRGPDGFVAVGLVSGMDVVVPRVWFSPDGRTWSLVMPNAQGGCGRILGVSAGGSGYVAVGYSCPDFATANTAVWTSSDGQKWEQVQIPELQNASLTDVVQRGEQLIIVGQRADRAVSFVSTNGEDWTESNAQADLRDAEMGSVIANGGSLLAIGRRGTSTDAPSAAVWTSDDGLTWTIAIGASTGEIIDAAAPSGPAGFVVIGGHFPSRSWQYDPSTEPPADTVEMWSSADGETFESASVLTGESLDWIGQPLVVGNEILVPARRWSSDSGAFVPVILRRAG
jgi:hypothetical protein